MANTSENLHKSSEGWERFRKRATRRAFANRTDSKVRSGSVRISFQNAKVAAMVAQGESEA